MNTTANLTSTCTTWCRQHAGLNSDEYSVCVSEPAHVDAIARHGHTSHLEFSLQRFDGEASTAIVGDREFDAAGLEQIAGLAQRLAAVLQAEAGR